jgi:hypothetical protein
MLSASIVTSGCNNGNTILNSSIIRKREPNTIGIGFDQESMKGIVLALFQGVVTVVIEDSTIDAKKGAYPLFRDMTLISPIVPPGISHFSPFISKSLGN